MIFQGFIEKMYRGMMFRRCEEHDTARYFDAEDFEGIKKEPYEFKNQKGETLRGAFYSAEVKFYNRIVIFEHGMGSGHRAYMREIVTLARHGYLVYSYDRTGCVSSDGDGIRGFGGSIADLDDCLKALKSDTRFSGYDFSVIGHSWGGLSTLNVAAYHPDVSHLVAISGPRSVEAMHTQIFSGLLKLYKKHIYSIETETNPDYVGASAIEALRSTEAQVLIIHSEDDKVVSAKIHFDPLAEALCHKENIRFLKVSGKNHNPNYTVDAVNYLAEYSAANRKQRKKLKTEKDKQAFASSFDWLRMTEQDPEVWKEIFAVLDK